MMMIKNRLALVFVIILLAFSLIAVSCGCKSPPPPPPTRAAIVDQLSLSEPNAGAIEIMTATLKSSGLETDYYQGEDVTVDFYKKLDPAVYKIIILRTHAGLLGSKGKTISRTCLFTNEAYNEKKYMREQLTDQLAMARIDENHPWVFAIGADFVERSIRGKYGGTVILMMGCSSLYIYDLAEAFVDKGASACIGWDASIGAEHMDKATLALVEKICSKKLTLSEAVNETNNENGKDPDFGGLLKVYPPKNGGLTLADAVH